MPPTTSNVQNPVLGRGEYVRVHHGVRALCLLAADTACFVAQAR